MSHNEEHLERLLCPKGSVLSNIHFYQNQYTKSSSGRVEEITDLLFDSGVSSTYICLNEGAGRLVFPYNVDS